MRLLDDSGNVLNSITILLTPTEAKMLTDLLQNLDSSNGNHVHVNDENYTREITAAIYTPENIQYFSDAVKNVIETKD